VSSWAALTTLDTIASDLDSYHLMHAARGCAGLDDETPRKPHSHVLPGPRRRKRSAGSSRDSWRSWP